MKKDINGKICLNNKRNKLDRLKQYKKRKCNKKINNHRRQNLNWHNKFKKNFNLFKINYFKK